MVQRLSLSKRLTIPPVTICVLFQLFFLLSCSQYKKSPDIKRTYYPNGTLESEITYVNGKKHGPFKAWNSKGRINSEGYFENDSLVGRAIHYYENGKKNFESNRNSQHKLDGLHRFWYSNGILGDSGYYRNGVKEGLWFKYSKTGQVQSIRNFRKGHLHGESVYFTEDSDTAKIENYRQGERLTVKEF